MQLVELAKTLAGLGRLAKWRIHYRRLYVLKTVYNSSDTMNTSVNWAWMTPSIYLVKKQVAAQVKVTIYLIYQVEVAVENDCFAW